MRTILEDPILEAWEATCAKNRDGAAILDAQGKILRTFSEIEEQARHFASQLEAIPPGQVFAIQIGNHPDWPSLFLACLRKQLVVLPLEQTISDEQKQSAFEIYNVAAAISGGKNVEILPPGTTAATTRQISNALCFCSSLIVCSSGRTTSCLRRQARNNDGQSGWFPI